MISLGLRLGGFRARTSYFFPTTRPRCNSTRPPFNHASKFRLVDAPSPSWRLGDGLPPEINHWKEVVSANRKTWDFTKLENIRSAIRLISYLTFISFVIRDSYKILTSAIVPRPIALVSTLSPDGIPNLAPFRFVFFGL